jgi:hypothetical protein
MMKGLAVIMMEMLMLVGCASQQQLTEMDTQVDEAVAKRFWHIDVTSMNAMRYGSRTVTPDFFLELRGDTLRSYLPYLGQAYQSPMISPSQGLNFEAPVKDYKLSPKKGSKSEMEISVKTQEDSYVYRVTLHDNGQAYIQVRPQHRDPISFDGNLEGR